MSSSSSNPSSAAAAAGDYCALTVVWRRAGRAIPRTLFTTDDSFMAVTVSGDTFSPPRPLIQGRYHLPANAHTNSDVARDGRFIHVLPIQPSRPRTRIEVVLTYGHRRRGLVDAASRFALR